MCLETEASLAPILEEQFLASNRSSPEEMRVRVVSKRSEEKEHHNMAGTCPFHPAVAPTGDASKQHIKLHVPTVVPAECIL